MTNEVVKYKYLLLVTLFCAHLATNSATTGDDHRKFQYNKPADDAGVYNFAYDTGSKDAHSMRMEHRDDHGVVRGRYGYTDPHGKLRMVEYEAGPQGFKARGDVGPDKSLHDVAPASAPIKEAKLTNLQLMGWDPERDPIETDVKVYSPPIGSMRIVQEPVVAIPIADHHPVIGHEAPVPIVQKSEPVVLAPITEDHPVKGYQAPVPIVQKSEPIVLAPITKDHPVKGYHAPVPIRQKSSDIDHYVKDVHGQPKTIDVVSPLRMDHSVKKYPVPPAPIKAPVKTIAVPARVTIDHPEKGYQAPVPIIQKTSDVRVSHVKDIHGPPKTIDVVAPLRADHPVKSIQAPIAHLEAPPKSIVAVEPIRKLEHLDRGDHLDKTIHRSPDVVAVAAPIKRYEEVHAAPLVHPLVKSVSVVAPSRLEHSEKGYHSPKHVHTSARAELDHHVVPPKSIALTAPVKTSRHVTIDHHEPPAKTVALVQPDGDHKMKGYVRSQPLVQKSAVVRLDRHVDKVHSHPKTVAVAAPVVDHYTKGYERVVHRGSSEGSSHYHQHLENVYGPWTSAHVDYRPKSKSIAYRDSRKDHHYHGDDYKSSGLRYYPVSSGKQRHYHVENVRDAKVARIVEDDRHHHHHSATRVQTADHDHPTFTKAKIPAARYHTHDGYTSAVVDRHSEVTTTDKHGKILDHYHQRLEPLTVHNIDVDPNEIRAPERPAQPPHHHHATYSASDRNSVRVATDVPVGSSEVTVRGRVGPRSVSNPTSSELVHASHGSRPRRVSYVPGNRYAPGTFVFA